MLRLILSAVLLLTTTMAQADNHSFGGYASVKIEARNGKSGTDDATAYGLTLGKSVNKWLDAEVYARIKDNDNDTNNTRGELATIGKLPIAGTNFSLYTRGALGQKFDGAGSDAYWSVEPGVKYALDPRLNLKAGLRFRDAFSDSANDLTRTYRIGAEFALTQTSTLSAGVDIQRGHSDYNTVGIGYSIKF